MSEDEATQFSYAFGQAVRERRLSLDLSQEQLGFVANLDRTYISGIERGTRNPTLRSVWNLAAALQTDPSKLINRAMRIGRDSGDF